MPDDPEHSVIYNVFDEIDRASDPDERRALLEQLTFSILPLPPKATSAERYFTETARKILLASLVAFYDKGLDFCEIMKVVFTNGPMELFQLIAAQKTSGLWAISRRWRRRMKRTSPGPSPHWMKTSSSLPITAR